jgi:hypothetical protein
MDACKGIDMPAGSIERAVASMKERGALFSSSADFI